MSGTKKKAIASNGLESGGQKLGKRGASLRRQQSI
jgi:hypothetical protein